MRGGKYDLTLQVSSKIGVIESLIEKVDKIILGGGMIFTFFKARGMGRRQLSGRGGQPGLGQAS